MGALAPVVKWRGRKMGLVNTVLIHYVFILNRIVLLKILRLLVEMEK